MLAGVASQRQLLLGVLLLLACSSALGFIEPIEVDENTSDSDSNYEAPGQNVFRPREAPPPPPTPPSHDPSSHSQSPSPRSFPTLDPLLLTSQTTSNVLHELHSALSVMQDSYFSLWLGKWTTAIDWTAAVMGTHLTASLHTLSSSLSYTLPGTFDESRPLDVEAQMVENEINKYFSQSIAYYFGEDHFSLRMQAYDDMLWVVLGWLDSIQFIESHSERHYAAATRHANGQKEKQWHGKQFIPAFAHRARIFYELAEQGWDWRLCGGGMTWNPRLLPYKNAITNELFIAASAAMYLSFPGDDNCSPFMNAQEAGSDSDWENPRVQDQGQSVECDFSTRRSTYDPIYLANAVHGYEWLKNVGLTNDKGLYVDGYHIRGYAQNHSKTTCDDRNEMVYTYNQGVVLSGVRGLWEGTGNATYLEDGHELIRNVIRATSWTDTEITSKVSFDPATEPPVIHETSKAKTKYTSPIKPPSWAGLGSHGILTELCDPSSTCSQDGQTFKGIFFHHLTAFCAPLPTIPVQPGKTYAATRELHALHRHSCNEYAPWVLHNGNAALKTKDREGKFGAWWGASRLFEKDMRKVLERGGPAEDLIPPGARDYRNDKMEFALPKGVMAEVEIENGDGDENLRSNQQAHMQERGDVNDRGRGRTVETQGGGVAVTRAMWEFLRNYEGDG